MVNCFRDVDEMVNVSQKEDFELVCHNLDVLQKKVNDVAQRKQSELGNKRRKTHGFKQPELENNIAEISKKKFAPQSKRKIFWAVNLYNDWRSNRMSEGVIPSQIVNANLDLLGTLIESDLCYSLSRFVREVKKLNGSEYPANTVHELVMIQMYLHENSVFWELLDQPQFLTLRNVVDNTMREHHSAGLGVRRSSNIITLDSEDKLFNKGILGEDTPEKLLKTVIYMISMHCALRGGAEHCNLRRPGCNSQFSFDCDTLGRERLIYREDPLQKTSQGGLVCKGTSKVVYIYGTSNRARCPIYLFKKYVGLMPQTKSCKKFYLRCRKVPTPCVWYCDQPYGINKLKTTVKDVCKEGGLEGHYTNHSLRATCASRLFDQNVPEQRNYRSQK